MTLLRTMIDLSSDAKALHFTQAAHDWLTALQKRGLITSFQILRRKMGLAADPHRDFLIEIEVPDMAALDRLFDGIGQAGDDLAALYDRMHQMIGHAATGIYRPFPDQARRERIALF